MEDERNIDFKKYTSAPVSKMYLLRIAFYIVLLGGLIYFFFSKREKESAPSDSITTIDNVIIQTD